MDQSGEDLVCLLSIDFVYLTFQKTGTWTMVHPYLHSSSSESADEQIGGPNSMKCYIAMLIHKILYEPRHLISNNVAF